MGKLFITIVITILVISNSVLFSQTEKLTSNNKLIEADGSILLPAQKSVNMNLTTQPIKSEQNWFDFQAKNPSWKVFFNGITGMPHRAFGKPIQVNGFSSVNENNIEEVALAFIEQNRKLFNISPDELKLRKKLQINNLWTLSYSQIYQGIEVLLTEVELRIRPDAKVMAFGINFYKDINLEIVPAISQSKAKEIAYEGLTFDNKKDQVLSDEGKLFILPVKTNNSVSFGLVREMIVDMPSSNQKFASYVDMHNGEILWRRNLIANVETSINVKGGVKLVSRLSEQTDENFGNLNLLVNGQSYYTDENGNVTVDISSASPITSSLNGKYAKVVYDGQTNASFTGTVSPGEPFNLLWSNNNSHRFERTLYYHANHAHSFYKMMDPVSKAMDFQLSVTIYNYGQPNAGSDLEQGNISFFGANGTSLYVVETPSVLYHEYGHSINTRLYKEMGISQGMVNLACHEALADLNAGLMTDQPKVGYLAFPDTNETIRNLVNTRKYPANINGESHNDGQILGGAFWDLRKVTNLDYARWLVHYTKKMGTPDDENTGIAFFEWFIETLITDDSHGDGDNDMSNGTPYSKEIIESFNKHDIGTKLAMQLSFEHTPYGDTQDTENPYKIQFVVRNPITFLNYEPKNVKLHYSNDGLKTKTELAATYLGNDTYEAYIPAMPKGTIMKYYMSALDEGSNQNVYFSKDNLNFKPYEFLIGYKVGFTDDFENSTGWIFGDPSDAATGGRWELGVPQLVAMQASTGYVVIQPGTDHSENGTKCLVTGASNGGGTQQGIIANMPNGKTTVISPPFDISGTEKPIFSYYRFFSNVPYIGGNPGSFRTLVSSNNGDNWVQVELTNNPTDDWEKTYFPIESFVQKSNRFRVKFEFTGYRYSGIPMYFAEGLVDDIEILTANDGANITDVQNYTLRQAQDDIKTSSISVSPNPFVDFVTISLNEAESSSFDKLRMTSFKIREILIFDIYGKIIKTLKPNNSKNLIWDATDDNGNTVSKGIYFVRTQIEGKYISEKIILE
ncbi:T9SS C-terminal target domain-containing protein [Bacteroidetes/Chlorobi group bacterium ChocPot_Mid]|nr:MAG: T9SS C-terminal target domain-containing protein [Bacteroidetes/Chlorobi group bacterium ChocPot_Mid]